MTGRDDPPPAPASATLTWAVRLLAAEAAGLVALAAYLVWLDLTAEATDLRLAVALTVLTLLAAASVGAVARALARRSAGARGPAIVVQLMVIAAGGLQLQTGPLWTGVALILLGAGTGLLTVLPSSTRALGVD